MILLYHCILRSYFVVSYSETFIMKISKNRIVIFLAIFFILVIAFMATLFLVKKYDTNFENEGTTQVDVSSSEVSAEFNPFSDLVKDTEYYDNEVLDDSMNKAFDFLYRNRSSDPVLRPIAGEREIVAEVVKTNGNANFKILNIDSQYYKYKVGELLEINPVIDVDNLMIQTDNNTVAYSWEIVGFDISSSLESGDTLVFICGDSTCSDNSLLWAFVFNSF